MKNEKIENTQSAIESTLNFLIKNFNIDKQFADKDQQQFAMKLLFIELKLIGVASAIDCSNNLSRNNHIDASNLIQINEFQAIENPIN